MKKRKILYLFPLAALVLSGCTFQEGWEITKNWTNEKVFTPVVEFFKDIFGIEDKKEEKKDDEKPTPSPSGEGEGEGQGGEGEGGGGGGQQGYVDPRDEYGTIHEGTQEDPLTGEDASLVASLLDESGSQDKFPTKESYYIKGVVQRLNEDFTPSYGNYSPVIENEFVGYRLKFGPNKTNFNEGDVAVGDTVTMYAQIINFHGTYETNGGYIANVEKPAIDAELVEIKLSGTAKSEYIVGNQYNHEGLVVTAVYDNGQEQNVTSAAEWTYSKEVAEIGDTSVTITATYQGFSQSVTVNVTVIEALNYGSLENPLTIEEAIAVIDKESPTSETVYVTGEVKSNKAYSTKYNNTEIWITDGEHDFELYGCSLPEGFTPAQPVENDPALVGKVVVAHGTAKKYNTTYELDKGCAIDSVSEPAPIVVESVVLSEQALELEVGQQATLSATVNPAKASQEVEWSVEQTAEVVSCDEGKVVALAAGTAVVTATSVADPTVSASCEVTVTEATKELLSIAITGTPKTEYNEGDEYTAEGLKVMAHYNVGEDEDVTANATIELSKVKAELGDTSFTVTASYGTAQPVELVVNVTVAEVNQFAEAYAAALAISSGETAEFTFKGVIVAKRQNNEWFIQHDGMGIEYYANNDNFAVGKLVKVTSTLQNYKGLPETKTIKSSEVLGDGTMPTPVELASGADVAAAKLNVLANVTGTAKADWSSYSASANNTLTLVGSDGQDIAVYFKSGLFSAKEDALKAVKEGDTVAFTNVVTSKFNSPQILFAAGSDLTVTPAPVKEIASITSVTGPTEVALNGTVSTNDVTVVVEYTDGSSGNAKVTAVTVDTSSAGQKTADVTIEGWNETLHFDITVSSVAPAKKYATKITSASEIVSGAKYYIGYENSGTSKLFNGLDAVNGFEAVTVSASGIEQVDSLVAIEISTMTGGYSLKVVGGTNNGKYIYGQSGSNALKFGTTASASTIEFENGVATIISQTSVFVFNSTSGQNRYRYYKPATVSGNPSVYLKPCIYMLAD